MGNHDNQNQGFTPPIITGRDDPESALSNYIRRVTQADLAALSRYESNRLKPYFAALENKLNAPTYQPLSKINGVVTYHAVNPSEHKAVHEAVPKDSICKTFNFVTNSTSNVILSEFMILPDNMDMPPDTPEGTSFFFKRKNFNHAEIQMGFIQCPRADDHGSISIPVFKLDSEILPAIQHHQTDDLFLALRDILTAGNHDMMHHLTSTFLNPDIARMDDEVGYKDSIRDFIEDNTDEGLLGDNGATGYEGWLLLSHAGTWRTFRGHPEGQNLKDSINRYYDALTKIDREMETEWETPKQRHDVLDYFSTSALFVLMRTQSFHSPAMDIAFSRAELLMPSSQHHMAVFVEDHHIHDFRKGDQLMRDTLQAFTDISKNSHDPINFAYRIVLMIRQFNNYGGQSDHNKIDIDTLKNEIELPASERNADHIKPQIEKISDTLCTMLMDYSTELNKLSVQPPKSLFSRIADIFRIHSRENTALNRMQEDFHQTRLKLLYTDIVNLIADDAREKSPAAPSSQDVLLKHFQCSLDHQKLRHKNYRAGGGIPLEVPLYTYKEQTISNYEEAGLSVLDSPPIRAAKTIELIEMAPEIAYIASPSTGDVRLDGLRKNARKVDTGVIKILQGHEPS